MADLAERKSAAAPVSSGVAVGSEPQTISVDVNGEKFKVTIGLKEARKSDNNSTNTSTPSSGKIAEILAPLEGKIYLTKGSAEKGIKVGDRIEESDIVC